MSDAKAYHAIVADLPDDCARLARTMRPGRWYAKEVLAELTGSSTHSISSRLSDLRKKGYKTEKRKAPLGERAYLYRIVEVPA